MSYSIYQNEHLVFEYKIDKSGCSINFYSEILKADVSEGLVIPYYLRSEFQGRSFVPYPPKGEDIKIFAEVYRRAVFEQELIKHNYHLKDEKGSLEQISKKV